MTPLFYRWPPVLAPTGEVLVKYARVDGPVLVRYAKRL
jgi:hypothetical protein